MKRNEKKTETTLNDIKKYINGSIIKMLLGYLWILGMLFFPIDGEMCYEFAVSVILGETVLEGAQNICCFVGVVLAVAGLFAALFTTILFRGKYTVCEENLPKSPSRQFIGVIRGLIVIGLISVFLCDMIGIGGFELSGGEKELLELDELLLSEGLPMAHFVTSFLLLYSAMGIKRGIYIEEYFRNTPKTKVPTNKAPSGAKKDKPILDSNNADLLLKYNQLYESGAITKEEYEKKKKELMGL